MSTRLRIRATSLQGVKVLERSFDSDSRGSLERLFDGHELRPLMGDRVVLQINRSMTSRRGTVRGMHFQLPPHAELKFVTCLRGTVFDVAVDIRRDSTTFLRWHAEVLGDAEHKTLIIPEGVAHGFQALSDDVELLYFHTATYQPSAEGGLDPRDPMLGITWPEDIVEISERDASHPMLTHGYAGVAL
jgi:dTDP-4-dehydrorhamnose 3,5-epimerase